MLNNLKALAVILVLASLAFRIARPLCLRYMPPESFVHRRNTWFLLTIGAFVSPSFWLFAAYALVVMAWSARRDDNPLALYVLVTFTIPDVHFYIPGLIVQQLFDLSQYRLLSLAILLPAVARMRSRPGAWLPARLTFVDVALLGFLLLQVALLVPYEAGTNTLRRSFLFLIDSFVVFYAFSRLPSKARTAEVVACFWLACLVMAPIAVFEWGRNWLLYTGLSATWGDPNVFSWIFRGASLRAQAAAGHSINLGYLMALAIGFFLYLRHRSSHKLLDASVLLVLATALFAAGARGPWVTAALIVLLFAMLRPGGAKKLATAGALCALLVAVMYATPLKEAVLDRLPFIGTADQETVAYRQRLAEVSYALIRQNPVFGDPFVYLRMESLRQGQGIIDIVNGYLYAALFTGVVGLSLLLVVFVAPTVRAARTLLRARRQTSTTGAGGDPAAADSALLGAALVSTMLGTMFYIGTAGYGTTTYILAGLLMSYAGAMRRRAFGAGSAEPAGAAAVRSYAT